MKDWTQGLDSILQFNEYDLLKDSGKVSHDGAMKIADSEYDKFRAIQDKNFNSDFERVMIGVKSTGHLPIESYGQSEEIKDTNAPKEDDKPMNFAATIKKISHAGKRQKDNKE